MLCDKDTLMSRLYDICDEDDYNLIMDYINNHSGLVDVPSEIENMIQDHFSFYLGQLLGCTKRQ